jgi:hypothetical protein
MKRSRGASRSGWSAPEPDRRPTANSSRRPVTRFRGISLLEPGVAPVLTRRLHSGSPGTDNPGHAWTIRSLAAGSCATSATSLAGCFRRTAPIELQASRRSMLPASRGPVAARLVRAIRARSLLLTIAKARARAAGTLVCRPVPASRGCRCRRPHPSDAGSVRYSVSGSLWSTAVVPFPSQAPRDSASRRTQYRNQSAP